MKTYKEMFSGQFPVSPSFAEDIAIPEVFIGHESKNIPRKFEESPKIPEQISSEKCDVKTESENPIPNESENLSIIPDSVSLEEHDIIAEENVQENGLVIYDESNLKEVKKGLFGRLVAKKRK